MTAGRLLEGAKAGFHAEVTQRSPFSWAVRTIDACLRNLRYTVAAAGDRALDNNHATEEEVPDRLSSYWQLNEG